MRPVPANARLIGLDEALAAPFNYDCMIGHNITDLLDLKTLSGPKILVIHSTIEGKLAEGEAPVQREELAHAVRTYVDLIHAHVVAVSELKGRSWRVFDEVIPFAADVASYREPTYELARGLRISNQLLKRARILMWDFHCAAFDGLPIDIVGHNPGLLHAEPAASWDALKGILSEHRFFVHTADPQLEDGYNMATLEAMAAGLPVLGNPHPSSPVTHGVDGFLSDDPQQLRAHAEALLADRELARRMGAAAREKVRRDFSMAKFKRDFTHAIDTARRKWRLSEAS
jgi:hypothetical protein